MKKDTLHAKEIYAQGGYSCVLCKDEKIYTSKETGIKPLMDFINDKTDLKGFCAADKIVGKAAAFLYVLMDVSEVYADVMTAEAARILSRYEISAYCTTPTDKIINRTKTDICPMEKIVQNISSPEEAYRELNGRTVAL